MVNLGAPAYDAKDHDYHLENLVALVRAITHCMHMYWALLYTYGGSFSIPILSSIQANKTLVSSVFAPSEFPAVLQGGGCTGLPAFSGFMASPV
jgi:hypothetical protein